MPDMFQQRPEWVEAAKLSKDNADDLAAWSGGIRIDTPTLEEGVEDVFIRITDLGEQITASEGDYIVKRRDGRFQTASADTFENMYEPIPQS